MKLMLICIFLSLSVFIKADIPSHCLKSQVSGKWTFQLTTPEKKDIAGRYKLTCGHNLPSHESTSYTATIDESLFTKTISIDLKANNEAYLDNKKGEWTMVYDEGFDINFQNKTETYFAFSKYGPRGANSKFISKWVSYCYAILIGWYKTPNDEWGCFKGVKDGQSALQETNGEADNKQNVVEGYDGTQFKSFLQKNDFIPESRFMETNSKLKLTSEFTDHAAVVDLINKSNLSWTAQVYSQFEGLSIKEMNHKLYGRRKSRGHSLYSNSFIESGITHNRQQPLTNLPKSIDYSVYLTSRNQGSCGSCYAIAALNSLEGRFRFKYGKELQKYYPDLKVKKNYLEF